MQPAVMRAGAALEVLARTSRRVPRHTHAHTRAPIFERAAAAARITWTCPALSRRFVSVPRSHLTRSFGATLDASDLRSLEHAANTHTRDPSAQLLYLSALHEYGLSAEVARRVESGRFAVEAGVLEVYARALARVRGLNDMDARELHSRLLQVWRRYGDPAHNSLPVSTLTSVAYAHASPVAPREDAYFGMSSGGGGGGGGGAGSLFGSGSAASGVFGGFGGSGSSAAPFGATAAEPVGSPGSRTNPLVVEMFASRRDWVSMALRVALWGGLAFLLYTMANRSMPGTLAQLTGDIAEEVTEVPNTRFADVKGVDEAKRELQDVVEFLRDPERCRRLGAKVPRGVLLTGPPGTGKTLLARAVAGEAGCKFYSKSASEFEEVLVGLGAKRVRDLFNAARKNAPAIIFIDEIDALGGKRRASVGTSSERQTLNQLLSSMDGFSKHENVIVIAATNASDILDPALTRPGRFDSKVEVPLPDINGRREIIDLYLTKIVVTPDVDSDMLARATPGFSGAQIEAMINSAAFHAAHRGADQVELEDLEEARDKVIMGPARKSRVKKVEEMRMTAYHEAGHTLVALLTKGAQPLHKVTILSRGMSGGATYSLQKDDSNMNKTEILASIDVAMGGRAAEELLYGADAVTTGAGMDMIQATDRARDFCMVLSMSELGLSSYARVEPSPERKAAIDEQVERILQASYGRVVALLRAHHTELDRLAGALLEYETLSADECRDVISGKILPADRSKVSMLRSAGKVPVAPPTDAKPAPKPEPSKPGVKLPERRPHPVKEGVLATAAPVAAAAAAATEAAVAAPPAAASAKKWV